MNKYKITYMKTIYNRNDFDEYYEVCTFIHSWSETSAEMYARGACPEGWEWRVDICTEV